LQVDNVEILMSPTDWLYIASENTNKGEEEEEKKR
jgi:hypothetical protein